MEVIDEILEENRKLKEQNQILRDAAQKYGWGIQYAIESMVSKAGNRAVLQVLNMKTMRIEMIGIQINNDGTITSPFEEAHAQTPGKIVAATLRPKKRKNRCENCCHLKRKSAFRFSTFRFRYECEHPVPGRPSPKRELFDFRPKYCEFYEKRKDESKHE